MLSEEQISMIEIGGMLELTFDARTPDVKKLPCILRASFGFRLAIGHQMEVSNAGDVAVDDEWKTYTLVANVSETWSAMKLGFEVSLDDADLIIDNINLRSGKITYDPNKPRFYLHENGVTVMCPAAILGIWRTIWCYLH